MQSRLHEAPAQRVDVAAGHAPAEEHRFDQRRAAAHERIVNQVTGPGEAFDDHFDKANLLAVVAIFVEKLTESLFSRVAIQAYQ